MVILDYDSVDKGIDDLRKQGHDIYWRGYSLVMFKPHNGAVHNRKGVFYNGRFGYEEVFEVQPDGTWHIRL